MIPTVLLFIIGFLLLVKGSDYFVKSAATIAKRLGVSEFIIGLTLVAIGTSIPELASSVIASIKKASGIVIGNIVGADIANIGLITGMAAVIAVIKTKKEMMDRDGYIMIFAGAALYIFIYNGVISKLEAGILLLLYAAYILFLSETKPELKEQYNFRGFIRYFFRFQYLKTIQDKTRRMKDNRQKAQGRQKIKTSKKIYLFKDLLIMLISGAAIFIGANYFINGAMYFANLLKIPETIIGVTLVSLGTTLPELSVTVSAARKGYGNIAIGNIIGSNITNILLVLGTAAFISPIQVGKITLFYTAPFMLFMMALLLLFIKSNWEIRRKEGIAFLILYVLFIAAVVYFGA